MTSTLPSLETVILDVPEVTRFTGTFVYSFFQPDESTTSISNAENTFSMRGLVKIPRYIHLSWLPSGLIEGSSELTGFGQNTRPIPPGYISTNLDKIMNESYFANGNMTSVLFNDQAIDQHLYSIVSGSLETAEALANSRTTIIKRSISLPSIAVQLSNKGAFTYSNELRLKNRIVNRLKGVNVQTQINNRFIVPIIRSAGENPFTTFSGDYAALYNIALTKQRTASLKFATRKGLGDYDSIVQHIKLQPLTNVSLNTKSAARVVGYIVSRRETGTNGESRELSPIIIENPNLGTYLDLEVKYYNTYTYAVMTIAEFQFPTVIQETGESVIATLLISSRPSTPISIQAVELVPPPPPVDLKFIWNYEAAALDLSWSFPPNSQRDIKKFQVFRRPTIREPFQLLQEYDFDDSITRAQFGEQATPNLVIQDLNPVLVFRDIDFTKSSSYIYALASIDAHGLTSGYSEQYEVGFNRFSNRVTLKRLSPSGAPKPYPNMYYTADAFVDLVRDVNHNQIRIAFNPPAIEVMSGENDPERLLALRNTDSYKIQFINTDSQESGTLEILLNDLRDLEENQVKE